MELIIGLLLAAFFILILVNNKQAITPKDCKPHIWQWEKQPGEEDLEYLRCTKCKKLPSEAANA